MFANIEMCCLFLYHPITDLGDYTTLNAFVKAVTACGTRVGFIPSKNGFAHDNGINR